MNNEHYEPYWFSPEDFELLKTILAYEDDIEQDILHNLRLEIGVAKTRTNSLTIDPRQLSSALGLPADSIPVYLNDTEKTYLLSQEKLPVSILKILQQ